MPYSNVSQLPKQVNNLPLKAKKIFIKAFNSVYSNSKDEEKAFKIAWSAVKKVFSKKGEKWVSKKSSKVNSVKLKGGLFGTSSYVDRIITSDDLDSDNETVSPLLMKKLVERNLVENTGDIEHFSAEGDYRFNKLFKLGRIAFKDNKLVGRFFIDKTHPKYNEYMDEYDNKMIGISAEFYEPIVENGVIKDCSRLGWSFHPNPKNRSTILSM